MDYLKKRKAIIITFLTMLICGIFVSSAFANDSTVTLQINSPIAYKNNQEITLNASPYIKDNRTMVPLRFIGETIGAVIYWDPTDESITCSTTDPEIIIWVNNQTALYNNEYITLDTAPQIVNDITFVPFYFVADSFELIWEWESDQQKINIYLPEDSSKITNSEVKGVYSNLFLENNKKLLKLNQDKLHRLNLQNENLKGNIKVLLLEPADIPNVDEIVKVEMINTTDQADLHGLFSAQIIQMIAGKEVKMYGYSYQSSDGGREAFEFAMENDIKIISASMIVFATELLSKNIDEYYEWGGIFVAATGNDPSFSVAFPGRHPHTIAVASTNDACSKGPEVHTAAESFWTVLMPDGGIHSYSGTSCSTPVIAGSIARVIDKHPEWGFDEVESFITENSTIDENKNIPVFRFPDDF